MSIDTTWLRCPNCLLDLDPIDERTLGCPTGHRFDLSKHGIVTLLPPKAPKTIGDDRDMLDARAALLDSGAYAPIAAAITESLSAAGFDGSADAPRIADLGCGTGLCGPLLRRHVRRLEGVDLSRAMLEQARATAVYDELHHADVLQHLVQARGPCDLVIAADVFIYVGALEAVFTQVARLMPAGGIFCFSAERGSVEEGLELLPSLRYAHGEGYLRRLAGAHGFELLRLSHETVREEQRRPIPGMIVHLLRSESRAAG